MAKIKRSRRFPKIQSAIAKIKEVSANLQLRTNAFKLESADYPPWELNAENVNTSLRQILFDRFSFIKKNVIKIFFL